MLPTACGQEEKERVMAIMKFVKHTTEIPSSMHSIGNIGQVYPDLPEHILDIERIWIFEWYDKSFRVAMSDTGGNGHVAYLCGGSPEELIRHFDNNGSSSNLDKPNELMSGFFNEEGSLNDWHDPIHWVDHDKLNSLEKDLREKKEFILENPDSDNYIYCLLYRTYFIKEISVLVSGIQHFLVTAIDDNTYRYKLLEPEHELVTKAKGILSDPEKEEEYACKTATDYPDSVIKE